MQHNEHYVAFRQSNLSGRLHAGWFIRVPGG